MSRQTTQHQVLKSLAKETYNSETRQSPNHHLHRATRLWAELDAAVGTAAPPPPHPAATCAQMAQCSGAILEIRAGVEAHLKMLKNAPKTDLGRVDRVLAHFVGLDASEFFTACLLTLSIEAERARAAGSVISEAIAQKVADALEKNAVGASVAVNPNFEKAIFRRIPFPTALRIVGVTKSPHTRTALLDEIYPDSVHGPDILLTEHAHSQNAKQVVQSMDAEAIPSWLDGVPAGPARNAACSLLVGALADLGRLHEIPDCLAYIDCPQKRASTAAHAALELARQGEVFGARRILAEVDDPQARVPCEVVIVVSDLSTPDDLPAAVEEMQRIEHGLVGSRLELLREWWERRPVLESGPLTFATIRALAYGWRSIGEQFFDSGCMTEALDALHRVPVTSAREGMWEYFLAKIPHSTAPETLLPFFERALDQAELRANRESEVRLVRTIVLALARSGNEQLLNRAFQLIEEKFADSSSLARAEQRDEAIALFFGTPPALRDCPHADELCGSISAPQKRGETQQLLALWAVFEGNKKQCEQRLRAAKASFEAEALENPPSQEGAIPSLFPRDEDKPKTPLRDLIVHLQTKDASTLPGPGGEAWYAQACDMALSLASHKPCGIFVVALRVADAPSFPSQETLFHRLMSLLRELYYKAPHENLFYPEICRHLEAKDSDATARKLTAVLESIDWQRSLWDDFWQEPTQSPTDSEGHGAWDSLLAPFSLRFKTDRFLKSVLQAAVPKVLCKPDSLRMDAFFDAATHLASEEDKIAIAQCVLLFAPGSAEPALLEEAAERFASEGGFLAKVRKAVADEQLRNARHSAFLAKKPFEEQIAETDFETAFQMVAELRSALEREKHITHLLQRSLDLRDRERFEKVFELAEQTFVESASKDIAEFTTWEAKPWFDVLQQIPENGWRLSLLNRTWDWFGLVPFPDKNPLLISWAEQLASLGHAPRALQVVREIPAAEDRALGFFKIALALGLLRGDPHAEEVFSWIPETVGEAIQQNDSCFRVLSEASAAFARAGDMGRFHAIHALGRHVLTSLNRHLQTGSILSGLLSSLVLANLAEPWIELVAFTSSNASVHQDMFHFLLADLEGMNFAQSLRFSVAQRGATLRHLLAFSNRAEIRPADEAKVFQICASGCAELLPLKEEFQKASSCHPELIRALLGNPWQTNRKDSATQPLTTSDLPWLATLCPYSAEATVSVIEHAVADALHREDWACIHRITSECETVPLGELKKLAEAVLASRRE